MCCRVCQVTEAPARLLSGSLPSWLRGSLVLNGVGEFGPTEHMFDGFAFLAKIRFEDGAAFASQRFLETDAYG